VGVDVFRGSESELRGEREHRPVLGKDGAVHGPHARLGGACEQQPEQAFSQALTLPGLRDDYRELRRRRIA
jgi:hypothetical protein